MKGCREKHENGREKKYNLHALPRSCDAYATLRIGLKGCREKRENGREKKYNLHALPRCCDAYATLRSSRYDAAPAP